MQRPAEERRRRRRMIYVNAVGPGHFKTLKIPQLGGRDFTYADVAGSSQRGDRERNDCESVLAWPERDRPAAAASRGERAASATRSSSSELSATAKYITIGEEPRAFMYRPLAQEYTAHVTLMVRAAGAPPADVIATLKREDPGHSTAALARVRRVATRRGNLDIGAAGAI